MRSWLCVLIVACAAMAATKTPAQELKDYHHTAWSSDSQIGAVLDIQQSPEGYLWLTTSKGVFRFDGVRFQSADEVTSGATQHFQLASVFVSHSGDVWLRTRVPGLLLWRDGRLATFLDKGCTPGLLVGSTVEDQDGRIWVAGSAGLFLIGEGKCERVGVKFGLPAGFPAAIVADTAGTVWVKMPSGELLYLRRNANQFQLSSTGSGPVGDFAFLHEGPHGSVWLSDDNGLRRISQNGIASRADNRVSPSASIRTLRFGNFTFDRNGALWAASKKGIYQIPDAGEMPVGKAVDPGGGQLFSLSQGLSSDVVWKLLVDHENVLWVGTNSGLDQLRRNVISQLSIPLTSEHQLAVADAGDGCVWTGSRSLPLTRACPDGKNKTYASTQQTLAIRRDYKGNVWSSGLGENRLWRVSNGVLDAIQYPHDELTNDSKVAASIAVDKQNKLWIATFGSHVYRSDAGRWENMDEPLGREPGILGAMEADQAGNVWFAFSNHVVEWDGIAIRKYIYGGTNRYPTCLNVRGEHVWLGAEDGIQFFMRGTFHMLRWKDQSLPGRITGIVETETGDLWTNGFSGVAHVSGEEIQRWLKDPSYAVAAESFNTLDGLPGLPADRYPEPSIVQGGDGRLWFSTIKGIAWLDPASVHNVYGSTPPKVFVSSVLKDGFLQSNLKDLAFAPGTESIEIDYTALGMAIPQRVLFRYRLDGVDKDWQDAGTRRQAFYTKLRPGRYQFSVIACNYFGVWNNAGAVLTFRVVPAWYQTFWFRCLVGIFVLASMWAIVVARSRQAAAKVELRMADRLMERDRIARELHDTLLQGVQALILRFQVVADSLPNTEPLRDITQKTLVHADQLLAEGRDRVKDLRSHDENADDLAASFERLREELRGEFARDFRLVIDGTPHKLHRVVRDEIELIAREALANAFRHAGATDILCAITFADSHFVLICEDDGIGIDNLFLSDAGKTNHWGLLGMRERAQRIGATVRVQRAATRGTVIELKVPARTAYREMERESWW